MKKLMLTSVVAVSDLVDKWILGLHNAPDNDRQLFTHIKQYVGITNVVSNTEKKKKKLDNLWWYLGPELVGSTCIVLQQGVCNKVTKKSVSGIRIVLIFRTRSCTS